MANIDNEIECICYIDAIDNELIKLGHTRISDPEEFLLAIKMYKSNCFYIDSVKKIILLRS